MIDILDNHPEKLGQKPSYQVQENEDIKQKEVKIPEAQKQNINKEVKNNLPKFKSIRSNISEQKTKLKSSDIKKKIVVQDGPININSYFD
jgi:hypothetical protein